MRLSFLSACLVFILLLSKSVLALDDSEPESLRQTKHPLTVAVASNFRYTLERVIESSQYWSDSDVRLVSGSSGTLYAQIVKGAPFDVFLSADTARPDALVSAGFGQQSRIYALGRLVVWPVPKEQLDRVNSVSINQYFNGFEGKLAIANPKLAPFGKAAIEVIDGSADLVFLKSRLVQGANVNQAFQFVDSGNAQAGIIAESLLVQAQAVLGDQKYLDYMRISSAQHDTIVQALVVLDKNLRHPQAQAFADFVMSAKVQSQLPKFGYDIP